VDTEKDSVVVERGTADTQRVEETRQTEAEAGSTETDFEED